jgi:hypothetical protein
VLLVGKGLQWFALLIIIIMFALLSMIAVERRCWTLRLGSPCSIYITPKASTALSAARGPEWCLLNAFTTYSNQKLRARAATAQPAMILCRATVPVTQMERVLLLLLLLPLHLLLKALKLMLLTILSVSAAVCSELL